MLRNARNVAIVLLLAAGVWGLPGGGKAASVATAVLGTIFLVLIVWALVRLYRERRVAIYSLGDSYRALLYGSIAAIVVATAALASGRLQDVYVLVWIVVVGAAAVGLYRVWLHYREYGY